MCVYTSGSRGPRSPLTPGFEHFRALFDFSVLFLPPFLSILLFLPPANEVCEGYVLHLSVSLSVHGGVCPSACWDTPPPPPPPRPEADTPSRSRHPAPPRADTPSPLALVQCMLGDTGNKWAVRILLECILVHNSNSKVFQPRFAWNIISQLMQIKSRSLSSWSSFHII